MVESIPYHLSKRWLGLQDKVNQAQKQSLELEKNLQKIKNQYIFASLSKTAFTDKKAHITIKVFSDIVELYHLYGDDINDDIATYSKCENCKFYFIQLHLAHALQKLIVNVDWSIWINICGKGVNLSKVVKMKDFQSCISQIIPVDEKIIDCKVSAHLIVHFDDGSINTSLDTIRVDISFHFEDYKKRKTLSNDRQVVEVAKSYGHTIDSLNIRRTTNLRYKFFMESKHFIPLLIRNSYHNINPNSLPLDQDSKNWSLKLSTGLRKINLSYNGDKQILTMESDVNDSQRLKRYFFKDFCKFEAVNAQKVLKEQAELLERSYTREDLFEVYHSLRAFWSTYVKCYSESLPVDTSQKD